MYTLNKHIFLQNEHGKYGKTFRPDDTFMRRCMAPPLSYVGAELLPKPMLVGVKWNPRNEFS